MFPEMFQRVLFWGLISNGALLLGSSPSLKGQEELSSPWRFLPSEIRHLEAGVFWGERATEVSQSRRADAADPLPAIFAFRDSLAEVNSRLLLVPVPPRSLMLWEEAGIAPEIVQKANETYNEFFDILAIEGIDFIDLRYLFSSNPEELFLVSDSHWSPQGIEIVANKIISLIGNNTDLESGSLVFERESMRLDIRGDLSLEGDDNETIELAVFRDEDGNAAERSVSARYLLLGDSHTLVFQAGGDLFARGGGLFDHLVAGLKEPVDLVGVRGSGATPARIDLFRRVQSNPGYWDSNEWVIWVFAAREFTESDGWRILPISR